MVDNTEIWTGANAHLTLVPESDLMVGFAGNTTALATAKTALSSGTYTGLYVLDLSDLKTKSSSGASVNSLFEMVTGLYSGCIADFYTNGSTLNHSLVIADNDASGLYFHQDYANSALNNAAAYVAIRKEVCCITRPVT